MRPEKKNQWLAQLEKKVSDGRDLWKKSATSATWKRNQRRTRATWKKSLRHAQLGEKSATGATWKKVSYAWILKNISVTGVTSPRKEVSDGRDLWKKSAPGATWKKSQRRTLAISKKNQRHAQPEKKSAKCATWEEVSVERNLKKKSAKAETWKKVSDGRGLEKQSATSATWDTINDRRNLWKKSATCTTWKRSQNSATDSCDLEKSQRPAQPGKKFGDMHDLWTNQQCAQSAKEVSTGATWRRRLSDRRDLETKSATCATRGKISDGRDLEKVSCVWILKKKSATGVT